MSSSSNLQTQAAPSAFSHTWASFWHMPSITVARYVLKGYLTIGWILVDIVFVWFLYALLFLEFGGNVSYFFATVGQGLGALAILSTVIMTQRAMSGRVYLPLAHLASRGSYVRGIILATAVLRIPTYLLMLALAAGFHRHAPSFGIEGATFSNLLLGSLGLLINSIIISTLTVLLSIPISTRLIQIIALAWIAAILYSNTSPGMLATILSFTRIPLAPLAVCYNLGTTPIGWYEVVMLVLAPDYIALLAYLASLSLARRDLLRL